MTTAETVSEFALSFPGTEESPHFERAAFKITGKRIFATLDEKSNSANIKLSIADQLLFCEYDSEAVYPVPNKFGEQGWTTFELNKVPSELIHSALEAAYNETMNSTGKGKKK